MIRNIEIVLIDGSIFIEIDFLLAKSQIRVFLIFRGDKIVSFYICSLNRCINKEEIENLAIAIQ